jgi:methyl-accepting chemotaxis protein
MRFSRYAPATLILSVIGAVGCIAAVSCWTSARMAASLRTERLEVMERIIQTKVEDAETRALSAAEILAAIPAVRRAFAARDKEGLYRITRDAFEALKAKYGISQAQFHLAPAISFLRLHNPGRPQEDLSGYRKIVVEVNQTGALRRGIEITASGLGILGTVPMTDEDGTPTGSFEVGMQVAPLLDGLRKDHGFEFALFINKDSLLEVATAMGRGIYDRRNTFGPFINYYSTHEDLMSGLVTVDDIDVTDDTGYVRSFAGEAFGVLLQPVYSYAGHQIGVLAAARTFDDIESRSGQALIWQALAAALAVVMLSGIILIVVRGFLLRPLQLIGHRFESLAGGGRSEAIDAAAVACHELRALAASYEKLRGRRERASRENSGSLS